MRPNGIKQEFKRVFFLIVLFVILLMIIVLILIKLKNNNSQQSISNIDNTISDSELLVLLKSPKAISDIACGNSGEIESRVYVRENNNYVPYIVIKTENYGEDLVLLMREEVFPKEMMFRDCNSFGAGGSYYPGSIIDDFAEKELYEMYSDAMQDMIRYVPVKIHTKDYVSGLIGKKYKVFETIYRHVFSLALSECNNYELYTSEDIEGDFISEVLDYPVNKYVWLRSDAYGGDDTWASQIFNGSVLSNRITTVAEQYVRPVFLVPANAKINKSRNVFKDNEVYIFSVDE
jgi:hypothetical protein